MENAAKALTIAGAILISLMVISAVVFMYRDLTATKREENENQKTKEITEFNKSYEAYNKEIYGSELFSLANKIEDYNVKYTAEDGYNPITLNINGIGTKDYIKIINNVNDTQNGLLAIYKSANNLEQLKSLYDKYEDVNNKNISEKEKTDLRKNIQNQINEINKKINQNKSKDDVETDWETYSKYKELKTKKFKCTEITYDKNGRVLTMTFKLM